MALNESLMRNSITRWQHEEDLERVLKTGLTGSHMKVDVDGRQQPI